MGDQRFDLVPFLAADFASPFVEEDGPVRQHGHHQRWFLNGLTALKLLQMTWLSRHRLLLIFELGGQLGFTTQVVWITLKQLTAKTAKIYYTSQPGLADHEYGVLQNSIAQKAFWEPKVAEAYASLDAIADLDPESDEFMAGLAEAQQIIYSLEADGEPVSGAFMF